MIPLAHRLMRSFSVTATIVGLVFLCAALTPSLLPRVPLVQGVLAGLAFAVGYGSTVIALGLWRFMELREVTGHVARVAGWGALAIAALATLATLQRMLVWQNSIRTLMEMEPVNSAYPMTVLAVAVPVAAGLILLARLALLAVRYLARWLARIMPPRVALVASVTVLTLLVVNLFNGVILKHTINAMDQTFAAIDQATDDDLPFPPASALVSGGPGSFIAWQDIGRNGKRFVTGGPTGDEIAALTARPALTPIRVYAGYNSGRDLKARAQIALAELIRVGGFEREVLIVVTPTGTGWIDPSSAWPVEYLHRGDIATVAIQYSYLPSWLTLMVDPDRSRRATRALFDAVYHHWTTLPADTRPRLYLFGLSLGALGSEAALDFLDMLGDPIQGAVLAGPPFASTIWPTLVRDRVPDSPAWAPVFRDASMVRFQTRAGMIAPAGANWGVLRIVYIQHGSDPMVWFSPSLAWRSPPWLNAGRAPVVSPFVRWFPLVTFLQIGFDVFMATSAPLGHAHNYAPEEYIDAWRAVSDPADWSDADTAALKAAFADFDPSPL